MITPGKVLATIAVGLTVPAVYLAWAVADRLVPPLIRRLDAAWDNRALFL